MKQLILKLSLLLVFLGGGILVRAQSEFAFWEKRQHKNIISVHGTMSCYFDGGPVFWELLWTRKRPHRVVPNGLDYLRMIDEKNGFMVSVTGINNLRAPLKDHVGFLGEEYTQRNGGFFSASYLRKIAGLKGLEVRGMLGASFMVVEENWIHTCEHCWESFGYGYSVHDFGLLAGVRADLALPFNFRLSGILQHTEYFKLIKDSFPRKPEGFDRFTRRRMTFQLGLGFSF